MFRSVNSKKKKGNRDAYGEKIEEMSGRFSAGDPNDDDISVSLVQSSSPIQSSSLSFLSRVQPEDTTVGTEDIGNGGDDDNNNDDDDDGESITPSQLVKEITIAWQNELCAPRLLPHMETVLDLMIEQIESMEENFSKCKDQTSLKIILHKMEVQRLTYIINEYIRVRLKKIEKDVEMLQSENIERERTNAPCLLSSAEKVFAERYEVIKHRLMETNFLGRIPPALQRLPTAAIDMSAERVIIEVTSDKLEQVVIPEMSDMLSDRTVDLPPGSIHFIPYPSIAELLEANKVRLL